MRVVVVTPISGEVISLADAKAHLKVETSDYDTVIQDAVDAAVAWADGPSGVLGMALGPQVLMAAWDGRNGVVADLPCGPVIEVQSVKWMNLAGVEQTVDPSDYILEGSCVRWRTGFAWPMARPFARVTYKAGFEIGQLPKGIRSALMLQIKILYDQPEDKRLAALEASRDALLSPIRRRRV